ncbi:MAG TPA: HNH endonuclease [Bacillota bacterium]|nr:HNH endonuclease [Bacillota bacterium]
MTFTDLKSFLTQKMRMSHIYQPLLIKTLLEAGGLATVRQLAIEFASNDESQILFYEKRLKEMPIRVLLNHEVILKNSEVVSLNLDIHKLTLEQKAELLKICHEKIHSYISSKGLAIWDYRLLDDNPIPDSLRYRVLTDAKGRCALCGATRDETVLHIDHIIPRSKGGKTVYENLQVLCAKCNQSKNNYDQTDFRELAATYEINCVLCQIPPEKIILENELAVCILDLHPITPGHSLLSPKHHYEDYFQIPKTELDAIYDLARIRRKQLLEAEPAIRGFDIGFRYGSVGQRAFHAYVHLIPRRKGDERIERV